MTDMSNQAYAIAAPSAPPSASVVTIFVRGALVETTIGVYPHERLGPRKILMDLEIETAPGNTAGLTDAIEDTVDYGAVVERIRQRLADERYFLLERAAECIAALVLSEFGAQRVCVGLFKDDVLKDVGSVGVRIERTNVPASGCDAPTRAHGRARGVDHAIPLARHRAACNGIDQPTEA